jgi:uncharacterized membrane protein YhaH (DUF805 family)
MNYDALFVNPNGRTSRAQFVPALLTVLASIAFFAYLVTGRTAQFCMLVLLYPACVLLARRVRDMGYPAWLVLVPLGLMLASFGIQLGYVTLSGTLDAALPWVALAVSGAFALWGCAKQ